MKNKTKANQIAIFERVIAVLQAIQTTPVASTSALREQVMPDLSQRTAQRYLKGLERAGYVSRVLDAGWHKSDARYFFDRKSKTIIWSVSMKKRNKKYNPKQIVKQKVHKFQMTWEVNEAKRIIEMHHLLGGVDPQESTHTPLEVWMNAHKGDLALALKTQTIPPEQSFHIVSRIHAVNKETGEAVNVDFQLATATTMHLWQFLGDEESEICVNDGGFEEKWLGFNSELEKYLESIEGDFEIETNHCCLTCFSTFSSFRHEMEFKARKLMLMGQGLGVAA